MGKRFFPASAGVAFFALACVAGAHDEGESGAASVFEVTPFLGHADGGAFEDPVTGAERDLQAGANWGVLLNLPATDSSSHYELLYSRQSSEVEGGTPLDVDVQYLQVGGTVSYPDAKRVIPYFGLTAGAARFSPQASGFDDETKWSFSADAGVRVPISRRFGMRFDARAFITLVDTDSDFFCVTPNAGGLTCRIRARSGTLVQYAASLGVSYRF